MTTFAVQWLDPVTGCPAYEFRDTETAANAEAARLTRTGIPRVVVYEAPEPHGTAALSPEHPATAPEGQHEDGRP